MLAFCVYLVLSTLAASMCGFNYFPCFTIIIPPCANVCGKVNGGLARCIVEGSVVVVSAVWVSQHKSLTVFILGHLVIVTRAIRYTQHGLQDERVDHCESLCVRRRTKAVRMQTQQRSYGYACFCFAFVVQAAVRSFVRVSSFAHLAYNKTNIVTTAK